MIADAVTLEERSIRWMESGDRRSATGCRESFALRKERTRRAQGASGSSSSEAAFFSSASSSDVKRSFTAQVRRRFTFFFFVVRDVVFGVFLAVMFFTTIRRTLGEKSPTG